MARCKYILVFCAVMWGYGVINGGAVSYGVRGGVISQTFAEAEWGAELWKALGGLIEYKFAGSPFSVRADGGVGLYQRAEAIKTTKLDLQLEVGPKYLWRIASSETAVYGGEPPSRIGISNGLALGCHLYNVEEKHADSLSKEMEFGLGLRLFGGAEYLISKYILFAEVGWGRILRGNFFQEEYSWTQFTFIGGVRF